MRGDRKTFLFRMSYPDLLTCDDDDDYDDDDDDDDDDMAYLKLIVINVGLHSSSVHVGQYRKI